MSALAAYRTAVLALLDDPGLLRYTNDQVDAALRWALAEYNRVRPLVSTFSLDTNGEKVIDLPADFTAEYIMDVERYNADPALIVKVPFHACRQDETWTIETIGREYELGEVLTVLYSTANTIDGLDSEAGTTVKTQDEMLIETGAAGRAALMRAVSQSESINLQPDVTKNLQAIASNYMNRFYAGLCAVPGAKFAQMPVIPTDTF